MSQPLARLGLRAGLRTAARPLPLPLASRVGVRAFSITAARFANPTPTDKYGVPDYSKGPSALDKASQLFFFTEIFRGASITSGWRLAGDGLAGAGLGCVRGWGGGRWSSLVETEATSSRRPMVRECSSCGPHDHDHARSGELVRRTASDRNIGITSSICRITYWLAHHAHAAHLLHLTFTTLPPHPDPLAHSRERR